MPTPPPTPEGNVVEFEVTSEQWSRFRVLDGSNLSVEVKPVVIEMIRTNEKDARGRAVYMVKAVVVTRAVIDPEVPEEGSHGGSPKSSG